jgi:hypothetical protein
MKMSILTLIREWAYKTALQVVRPAQSYLPRWLNRFYRRRPRGALEGNPTARVVFQQ